jgi:hypothetical protein
MHAPFQTIAGRHLHETPEKIYGEQNEVNQVCEADKGLVAQPAEVGGLQPLVDMRAAIVAWARCIGRVQCVRDV